MNSFSGLSETLRLGGKTGHNFRYIEIPFVFF
ncbi:hypothetical protein MATR_30350 [Marivirga tractuosa]|uniref:Uncharacterized protein n=1 Tax=Marivirga tractuosa (strain ATCC 23168 / DSM 4126 / NBRC 15989 / NCIMB 1408 / VKM B-1430 / H-43) TaxID=643867 RepID=E4TUM3_MARTH|nr:hypothetical protein Ftrac_3141 [Marivirga tractuosa DSM 4126]BDD16210.1 hypothetical protein MATR_30350 [Marivirga tractuosa]